MEYCATVRYFSRARLGWIKIPKIIRIKIEKIEKRGRKRRKDR